MALFTERRLAVEVAIAGRYLRSHPPAALQRFTVSSLAREWARRGWCWAVTAITTERRNLAAEQVAPGRYIRAHLPAASRRTTVLATATARPRWEASGRKAAMAVSTGRRPRAEPP